MKVSVYYPRTEICFLVFLIFVPLTSITARDNTAHASPLILGSIQFPNSITRIPSPRIYCAGKTIPCEIHDKQKKITFDWLNYKSTKQFYLLITESITHVLKKHPLIERMQTIDYITVPEHQSYKLYHLAWAPNPANPDTYTWHITPQLLNEHSRRLPDETIIVLYMPSYVHTLAGGNALELPTIIIKSDVLDLAGSEDALLDQSITLQMACLNSDTIHSPLKHAIKQIGHRTLIAPTA
jgi:hypothetical protein